MSSRRLFDYVSRFVIGLLLTVSWFSAQKAYAGGHRGASCGKKCCALTAFLESDPQNPFPVFLAGSSGMDKTFDELPDAFTWTETFMFSVGPPLGRVRVKLNPNMTSFGDIVPIGGPPYPATSSNAMFFHMELLDQGMTLFNQAPISLTTTINQFPPVGAMYPLAQPVPFFDVNDPNGPPILTIQNSNLKIAGQSGFDVSLQLDSRNGNQLNLSGTIVNLAGGPMNMAWYCSATNGTVTNIAPEYEILVIGNQINVNITGEYTGPESHTHIDLYAVSLDGGEEWAFDTITVEQSGGTAVPVNRWAVGLSILGLALVGAYFLSRRRISGLSIF